MADHLTGQKNRRQRHDTEHRIFTGKIADKVDVPEGLELDTVEKQILWDQYSKTRLPENWTPFELVQLHRLCCMEVWLRELEEKVNDGGFIEFDIRDNRITSVELKALSNVSAMHYKLAVQLRLFSAGASLDNVDTTKARAREHQIKALAKADQDHLLAIPDELN